MIRAFVLALALAALGAAQQNNTGPQQLDSSQTLFTVMAAINAAGYDAELDSPSNSPLREMVRREIAAKNPACLSEIKTFYIMHRQKDWTAELSQYISFALSVGDPPGFEFRYRANELPPDVAELDGLRALLKTFYKQADIESLWRRSQPYFEDAIARYHKPAMDAVMHVNAYVRTSTSAALNSRFQVYVDLLAAPNQIQMRNYKNDSFLVVTASAEPQADDVRHAYLHYVLDPLAVRYGVELDKKKALLDYAQPAPVLESYYKTDFRLLADECLIKAVESRLAPPARRQMLVDQAFREGFILVPAFAEALPAYEKQEQSLRFYFAEVVKAIDLKKEDARLAKVDFATERQVRRAKVVPAEQPVPLTGVRKTLDEANRSYENKDLDGARAGYRAALSQTQEAPLQAKALFGLARIAALQKQPDDAEKLFEQALHTEPDPITAGWAHLFLGRLEELKTEGDARKAAAHYRAVLEIEGSSPAARNAAQKALGGASAKPQRPEAEKKEQRTEKE